MSMQRMPKMPKVGGHDIIYHSDPEEGYWWACECGEDSGTPFVKAADRRYDALHHLLMAGKAQ